MKRSLFLVFVVTILTMLRSYAYAEENINVTINDEPIIFDAQPIMKNDRILVPIRKIAEKMLFEVTWEEDTQEITLENFNTILTMNIGDYSITKDLKLASKDYSTKITNIRTDIPSTIIDDRTYLPLRIISELFGAEVNWNESNNTAEIFYANTYGKEVTFEDKGVEYLTKLELLLEGIEHNEGLKSFTLYTSPELQAKLRSNTADELYPIKVHQGALKKIEQLSIAFYDCPPQFSSTNDIKKFPNLVDPEAYISFLEIPHKFMEVIKESITDDMDDRQKIAAINKWIVENIHYDYNFVHLNELLQKYSHLPSFVTGKLFVFDTTMLNNYAVCSGFAVTFEAFCDILNIPCICCGNEGYGTNGWGSHCWNVVKLEDAKFYHIDTCWNFGDNPRYFLLTSEELNEIGDHRWKEEDIIRLFKAKYEEN